MNTKDIANKLVEYCRTGKFEDAYRELYSPNCVSIEMDGVPGYPPRVEGMEAIAQKSQAWQDLVEEFHGMEVSDPVIAGDRFSCSMAMDIKMKGRDRSKDEEIALYTVKDGKIVEEQFFYAVQ